MKKIAYSKDAIRILRKMPANVAVLVRAKIEQYAEAPASLAGNVKILKGSNGAVRLRVGDWRVIMTDDGEVLAILKVAPRGSAYD